LKRPLFVLLAVIGLIAVVVGIVGPERLATVAGAVMLAVSLLAIGAIRRGENPWWIRSPLDRRSSQDPRSE
jgi:hypothetical protein